ncbi:MAG: hypothetical protein ACLPKE_13950 [Streptosporangiaceae bacterium]
MTPAVGRTHRYEISLTWTGNRGTGTSDYRAYGRSHDVHVDGLPPIAGSSDRAFHGDRDRWNDTWDTVLAAYAAEISRAAVRRADRRSDP